jgi:hypothetical protein
VAASTTSQQQQTLARTKKEGRKALHGPSAIIISNENTHTYTHEKVQKENKYIPMRQFPAQM